jgi:hypothetical protein
VELVKIQFTTFSQIMSAIKSIFHIIICYNVYTGDFELTFLHFNSGGIMIDYVN